MEEKSAAAQIDDIVTLYGGWKGATLARLRAVITAADPHVVEEIKWRMATRPEGLPVWSHDGIVCLAETFKDNIKLVFVKGVYLQDPQGLFNARLSSKTDRAIQLQDGDSINMAGLTALVREAVQLNVLKAKK